MALTEATLDRLLSQARAEVAAAQRSDFWPTPVCLGWSRARAIALDPQAEEPEERRHRLECRSCDRLTAGLASALPHLSFWTLLRAGDPALPAAQRQAVEYHLHQGRCARCRRLLSEAERLRSSCARLLGPIRLPGQALVHAATATPVRGGSPDGALHVELVPELVGAAIEVATRDPGLAGTLVSYRLSGEFGEERGYLVLETDVDGWFAGFAHIRPERPAGRMPEVCDEIEVAPVSLSLLSEGDEEDLVASVERSREHASERARWLGWVERQEQPSRRHGERSTELLRRLRARLAC